MSTPPDLVSAIAAQGFAFRPAVLTRPALEAEGLHDWPAAWDDFARSWDDLGLDTYMADGGRYRRRRHAAFAVSAEGIARKPHQPHYQSRDYNALNGGIARWFAPVTEAVADGPVLPAVLRTCRRVFDALAGGTRPWHVEVHQFRIEARPGEPGQPTPEGMHRDGVDYVLVLLAGRRNIASGETSIHDLHRHPLGSFTLTDPLDAAWVDDRRVYHGVTAVRPIDPDQPAHRDVLVVTFRTEDGAAPA